MEVSIIYHTGNLVNVPLNEGKWCSFILIPKEEDVVLTVENSLIKDNLMLVASGDPSTPIPTGYISVALATHLIENIHPTLEDLDKCTYPYLLQLAKKYNSKQIAWAALYAVHYLHRHPLVSYDLKYEGRGSRI
jgi:hypothetical protein